MEEQVVKECKVCKNIKFKTNKVSSHLMQVTVVVPAAVTKKIRKYVLALYQENAIAHGLQHDSLPEEYITERYKEAIHESVCRFGLKFIVLDNLLQELRKLKTPVAHHPRIQQISSHPDGSVSYNFRISTISDLTLSDWSKLSFNPPRRKLYKDLDRQANFFIEQEHENPLKKDHERLVSGEDWVGFEVSLLNKTLTPSLRGHSNKFWMKISTKYLVCPFQKLFLDKKVQETFIINTLPVQGFPRDVVSTKGSFMVKVNSVAKSNHFSFPLFQSAFKLDTKEDVHEKLIEIFSYRNDISQRRSIIEETFRTLFSRFRFEIPRHLTLRKQETLFKNVQKIPDYHVYKSQPNFIRQLESLAEKQLKEEILVDLIANEEEIKATDNDVLEYLNLFSHDRLKEFIYFRPDIEQFGESSTAIRAAQLTQTVRREKALNQIIQTLTHKDTKQTRAT